MELARYLVDAVVLEKRSCREVARAHGVSKSWVAKLVARFKEGGYEALAPGSKAAKRVANRSSAELEERVVRLRKELSDQGFDAGAQTIHITSASPIRRRPRCRRSGASSNAGASSRRNRTSAPRAPTCASRQRCPTEMWQHSIASIATAIQARETGRAESGFSNLRLARSTGNRLPSSLSI